MKVLYLMLVLATAFLVGCSSEDTPVVSDIKQAAAGYAPYQVSLNDALKKVEPIMEVLDGVNATRSNSRVVGDIEYVVNNKTRGQDGTNNVPDTLFYIVNYADEQGFVVLSADIRIPSIMAISNIGNMALSDTTNNRTLARWLENITYQSNETACSYGALGDFDYADSTYRPPHLGDRVIEITKHIKPHLDNFASRWGQKAPYNSYAYGTAQKRWALGCGPLAIAQIMSFHKWPNVIEGVSIDWDEVMKLPYEYDLSNPNFNKFYKFLAKVQSVSGAYPEKYPVMALKETSLIANITRLGYQTISAPAKFGSFNMFSKLDKEPLLIASSIIDSSVGHMWVMDGILSYKETWDALVDGVRFYTMYHCVWGWDGANNGYFMFNTDGQNNFIDTTKPSDFEAGVDLGYVDSKSFYKIYDLRFWTLTPKKQ